MALFIYPPNQASIPGVATEATLLDVEQNTANTVTELQTLNSDIAELNARIAGSLVPEEFDYQSITYVGATTDISTVTYKLGGAGGTTVAVLTLAYDGSNRLISVTRS